MGYKDKDKQRKYEREWIAHRRQTWLSRNGPCVKCKSYNKLCIHHVDKNTKISHNVWSWKEERRNKELAKCIILCEKCHKSLHAQERKKIGLKNTSWCRTCKQFLRTDYFTVDNSTRTGYDAQCKECKSKRRKQYYYSKQSRRSSIGRASHL